MYVSCHQIRFYLHSYNDDIQLGRAKGKKNDKAMEMTGVSHKLPQKINA